MECRAPLEGLASDGKTVPPVSSQERKRKDECGCREDCREKREFLMAASIFYDRQKVMIRARVSVEAGGVRDLKRMGKV